MEHPPQTPDEIDALIGEGCTFQGVLTFEGCVRIDGHFRGRITAAGTLVVGAAAVVEADVDVASLIVLGGVLKGKVRASKNVEIYKPSKVYGDIDAPELAIDKGVVFEGRCIMANGVTRGPAVNESTEGEPRRVKSHL